MPTWFLVEVKVDAMPRWCQIGPGGVWMDGRGIAHVHADQRVFLHRDVDLDRELITDEKAARIEAPMAARSLLRPDSDSGWVSPDGRFWGCGSAEHEWLLHSLIRKTVPWAAREGWVRVYSSGLFHSGRSLDYVDYEGKPLNQRQRDTLFDLGFVEIEPFPKRLFADRRGPADKERPFAVREHQALDALSRTGSVMRL